MWDLPGPGLEPASPALAGGFLTTAPPGKSCRSCFNAFLGKVQCWLMTNSRAALTTWIVAQIREIQGELCFRGSLLLWLFRPHWASGFIMLSRWSVCPPLEDTLAMLGTQKTQTHMPALCPYHRYNPNLSVLEPCVCLLCPPRLQTGQGRCHSVPLMLKKRTLTLNTFLDEWLVE